ncbi:MAG: AMP-binding protein, partial [Saccharothrix sp.]|nr:AMP-binding protein [Saccharothrix sp.]
AYYVLLTQHGAGSDVVIGTPVNVRDQQSMNAIGYHANLLPLRVTLDAEADFRAVVKKTRSTFLEAISHADVPLEHVSPAVLGDAPSSWRSSFFRHLFNYVPGTVEAAPTLTGMPVRHVLAENGYSRFDLEFFIMPGPDDTTIRAAFCVDAFAQDDVVRLLERYDSLLVELGGAVERPVVELSRLSPAERVLPPVSEPSEHVLDAVYATVSTQPDLVAVEDGPDSVTYGELWSAALDTRDLVNTDTVAVLAPRGADLAAAWLGVWLAGARVVLLDPTQPIPDLAARLADSGAGLVLAAEGVTVPGAVRVPGVGGGSRTGAPASDLDAPAHLEYALTGEPIAVEFAHRALANAVVGQDKALWQNSAATTASLLDVLGALTTGGRVVVADTEHTAPVPAGFITEPGTAHELGVGVRGELCATGNALPTRYPNRPDLTAERFGEHPVHGRFHRTGDLAVRRADGVDVIGPLDACATVAGQRIHLADVERALSAVAPVAAAEAGGTVFVFTETDATDRLRERAKAVLPFVPEPVTMTKIPRTAASTVDRVALRELAESTAVAVNAEPPDEATAALVALWTELLDRPGLHADSNFFTSGGHSLLGAQLVQKVKKELGLPAQLADLFANPTPRQLAEHLDSAFFDDEDDEDEFDEDEDDD